MKRLALNPEKKSRFAELIMNEYVNKRYGTLTKTEIEELLYKFLGECSNLNELSDYEKSISLHLPVNRIKSIAYKSRLIFSEYNEAEIVTEFFNILWRGRFEIIGKDNDFMVKVEVEDQYVREGIKSMITGDGRITDSSFNASLITMSKKTFLDFLNEKYPSEKKSLLLDEIRKQEELTVGISDIPDPMSRFILFEASKDKVEKRIKKIMQLLR